MLYSRLYLGLVVFRVCSNASQYVPLLGPLARAHAHSSTVMWDALRPSIRHRRRETGLVPGWRQCAVCPVHAVHAVTAQALPPHDVLHRVGSVAQLSIGSQACTRTCREQAWSRDANRQSWSPGPRPCPGLPCTCQAWYRVCAPLDRYLDLNRPVQVTCKQGTC